MNPTYKYALKILTIRDLSAKRLRDKLIEKKFPLQDIQSTIEEFIKLNYLNDERYIEMRVRGLLNKKLGPLLIQSKLEQEGIRCSLELIEQIADEAKINIEENKQYLIEKKKASLSPNLDEFNAKLKIIRYLHSKGYINSSTIWLDEDFL